VAGLDWQPALGRAFFYDTPLQRPYLLFCDKGIQLLPCTLRGQISAQLARGSPVHLDINDPP